MQGVNKDEGTFWRYLLNFWTLVLFAIVIEDFISLDAYAKIIGPVSAIYVALLAIYSAEKEFERWHFEHMSRHPGEIYVILWTILLFGILVADFILKRGYALEPEVVSTYIAVLAILAVTKKSKSVFKESHTQ
jgi:hypothetical protein